MVLIVIYLKGGKACVFVSRRVEVANASISKAHGQSTHLRSLRKRGNGFRGQKQSFHWKENKKVTKQPLHRSQARGWYHDFAN